MFFEKLRLYKIERNIEMLEEDNKFLREDISELEADNKVLKNEISEINEKIFIIEQRVNKVYNINSIEETEEKLLSAKYSLINAFEDLSELMFSSILNREDLEKNKHITENSIRYIEHCYNFYITAYENFLNSKDN